MSSKSDINWNKVVKVIKRITDDEKCPICLNEADDMIVP